MYRPGLGGISMVHFPSFRRAEYLDSLMRVQIWMMKKNPGVIIKMLEDLRKPVSLEAEEHMHLQNAKRIGPNLSRFIEKLLPGRTLGLSRRSAAK